MTCLSGGVEELRFSLPPGEDDPMLATPRTPAKRPDIPGVIDASTPCPRLAPGLATALAPGQTAYISDAIVRAARDAPTRVRRMSVLTTILSLFTQALHAVRCGDAAAAPRGGVSLHVYAPPIRRTRLYEPDADRVTLRAPGFFSAAGRVLQPAQGVVYVPAAAPAPA
jgi:cysteine dioxygenase